MKKKREVFGISALLFFVWIVMNEAFTPLSVLTGLAFTAFCLFATNTLLDINYTRVFSLPLLPFLKYLLFLLKEIYRNGICAAILILKGTVNPEFFTVEIDKNIQNLFLHTVLESSITLTPGTISLENKEGIITVLSMHRAEEEPTKALEVHLANMKRKNDMS